MASPSAESTATASDAGAPKDETISPEMIEAGLKVLYESGLVDGPSAEDSLVLAEIFRSMASCRPS